MSANRFSLPCQYRQSSTLSEWTHLFAAPGQKKPLDRRISGSRFGDGGVAIAVSRSYQQMVNGVNRSTLQLISDGYSPEDIVLTYSPTDKSASAVLGDFAILNGKRLDHADAVFANQLLAFLELTCGRWGLDLLTTVALMPDYNIPLPMVIQQFATNNQASIHNSLSIVHAINHEGARRLSGHIQQCSLRKSLRSRLAAYLYDVGCCLRKSFNWSVVPELLLQRIPGRDQPAAEQLEELQRDLLVRPLCKNNEVRALRQSALATVRTPVLIVVGAELELLGRTVSAQIHEKSSTIQRQLAAAATDSILYCVVESEPKKALNAARRISSSFKHLAVRDWTNLPELKPSLQRGSNPAAKSVEKSKLFLQCPRRVYYATRLEQPGFSTMEMVSADYPPRPADSAMCQTCAFARLCPVEID